MTSGANHGRGPVVQFLDAPAPIRQVFFIGWHDAIAGRPFSPGYDDAPEWMQEAYEDGRMVATNVLAAGLHPPAWVGDENSRAMVGAWACAAMRIGDPIVKRRQNR